MPPAARHPASPPFVHREFNGEVLLDELAELRGARVRQPELVEIAREIAQLRGRSPAQAASGLAELARGRFASPRELSALLTQWGKKVRSGADVELLAGHFQRLALAGALVSALRSAAEALPGGGRR